MISAACRWAELAADVAINEKGPLFLRYVRLVAIPWKFLRLTVNAYADGNSLVISLFPNGAFGYP